MIIFLFKIKISKYLIMFNITLINSYFFLTNSGRFPRKFLNGHSWIGLYPWNIFLSTKRNDLREHTGLLYLKNN